MHSIRRITHPDDEALEALSELLVDVVNDGASIGFHAPLSRDIASQYWHGVWQQLDAGLCLWVAESEGKIIGTVQLSLCPKENGQHRADVQKLLVHPISRKAGAANALMSKLEKFAFSHQRTLLVLDTESGSRAEIFYKNRSWQRVGEIPNYVSKADGKLYATTYFFKNLSL